MEHAARVQVRHARSDARGGFEREAGREGLALGEERGQG